MGSRDAHRAEKEDTEEAGQPSSILLCKVLLIDVHSWVRISCTWVHETDAALTTAKLDLESACAQGMDCVPEKCPKHAGVLQPGTGLLLHLARIAEIHCGHRSHRLRGVVTTGHDGCITYRCVLQIQVLLELFQAENGAGADVYHVQALLELQKPGPELGKAMGEALNWQLAHPSGSLEECQQHVKEWWQKHKA
eukprot:1160884-Pelagomonas_calceolata.AAC.14